MALPLRRPDAEGYCASAPWSALNLKNGIRARMSYDVPSLTGEADRSTATFTVPVPQRGAREPL